MARHPYLAVCGFVRLYLPIQISMLACTICKLAKFDCSVRQSDSQMIHSVRSVQTDGKLRVSDYYCSPGACFRSSDSFWDPGRNLMQPFSSVESDTASQQVAAEMSDVKGGQYAMS